jgi:dienelactone hydrolase
MKGLVACVVAASTAFAWADAASNEEQQIRRARQLFQLLVRERYEEFSAAGDETMRSKFDGAAMQRTWAPIKEKLGRYRSERSARLERVGEFESIQLVAEFERGTLTLRIVLNQEGRLSGLWFDKVELSPDRSLPPYVDRNRFREEKVTVSARQFALPGTMSIPNAPGPHAGVVLVHGAGPNDRDGKVGRRRPLRDLALGLATRGIGVLRYDKRTYKYPRAQADQLAVERGTIEDVLAALRLLRQRTEIDPRRVFIVGHSGGGFLAPFIARQDGQTAGIALLAANARSLLDVILDQHEYKARLDGNFTKAEQAEVDKLRRAFEPIREGKLDEAPPLPGLPVEYLYHTHQLDAVAEVQKLTIPVLILQGERDFQVNMKDFAIWKERLADRPKTTLKSYPKLDHIFIAGEGKSRPDDYKRPGHVDVNVIEDLTAWIKSVQPPATTPH